MVNYNFELTWYNDEARQRVLSGLDGSAGAQRSAQSVPAAVPVGIRKIEYFSAELLRVHLALAKNRLAKSSVLGLLRGLGREELVLAEQLYDESVVTPGAQADTRFCGRLDRCCRPSGKLARVRVVFPRRDISWSTSRRSNTTRSLLDFLSQRDSVIRDLMRKRLPVLTPLAVMVADLQNSVKDLLGIAAGGVLRADQRDLDHDGAGFQEVLRHLWQACGRRYGLLFFPAARQRLHFQCARLCAGTEIGSAGKSARSGSCARTGSTSST